MTMTISGSGTITGLSAGGLPDATIVQADLAANVASNGPAFSAYQSSTQSISAGTFTKIQFQTEEFDTNSNYDNATNYRFTPTVAGYYQVTILITNSGSTWVNGFLNAYVYKNGSAFKGSSSSQPTNGNYISAYCNALVFMNGATDYIEAYTLSGGNAANWAPVTGNNFTYFQAAMIRSA